MPDVPNSVPNSASPAATSAPRPATSAAQAAAQGAAGAADARFAPGAAYLPRLHAHSLHLGLRHHQYHLLCWGDPARVTPQAPALVLLHGWMDVAASFQFLVDELDRLGAAPPCILAPDWRGFGASTGPATDGYWFPDYLGDLEGLIDALLPGQQVDLLGHSMGGNVAMIYAGVRPERVRCLINLEGFGMPRSRPEQAPKRYRAWLDELKTSIALRDYPSVDAVAERLRNNNPRLSADKAAWLAPHWAAPSSDGRWHIQGDPAHKRSNPVLYRVDEVLACWREITAPVLWVEGADTDVSKWWGNRYPRDDFEARLAELGRLERQLLTDCAHMLHHDQPAGLAGHIARFLAR
jgi:pimeloyl-ACP methyl ester carboxylesterase